MVQCGHVVVFGTLVMCYLFDSLDHGLQPVCVDLTVTVQEGEDGGRGRWRPSDTRPDQTWSTPTHVHSKIIITTLNNTFIEYIDEAYQLRFVSHVNPGENEVLINVLKYTVLEIQIV